MPLGTRGERYAGRWLRRQGYRVVAGGNRSRYGEVDLIAVDGQTIVFVEVKTRRSAELGDAAQAVDAQKQQRIVPHGAGVSQRASPAGVFRTVRRGRNRVARGCAPPKTRAHKKMLSSPLTPANSSPKGFKATWLDAAVGHKPGQRV